MCHFITATLPSGIDVKKAEDIFAKHKLRFEVIENESVREHLNAGDFYILTTQGMCDCGTVLGSEYREEPLASDEKEKFRRQTIEKFKKKGWSQTKIDRWFNEAVLTEEKENRSRELQHESAVSFVSDWIAFIKDMLGSKVTPKIGLLLHMYDGALYGRFTIVGKKRVSLKELNESILLQMAEDVIYEFVLDRRSKLHLHERTAEVT